MILQTRAAKIILSLMAIVLLACAIFVGVTGWDGTTDTYVSTSASEGVSSTPSVVPTPEDVPPPLPQTPSEESTAPVVALTGIYIDPQYFEIKPGEEFSVNLIADLTGRGVSGCEVVLEFDSTVFQLTDVVSGDLLGTDPLIGTKNMDNTTGKVRYAIARKGMTDVTASTGVLSTFSLLVLNSAPSGSYDLTIGDLMLTDHDFKEMAGYEIHSGYIEVIP